MLCTPSIACAIPSNVLYGGGELDFMIAAVLLLGTGLLVELVVQLVKHKGYRMAFVLVLVVLLVLVWLELAVGVVTTTTVFIA